MILPLKKSLARRFVFPGLLLASTLCPARADVVPAPKAEAAKSTVAVKMTDFLDSLGVCTHMAQGIDDPTKSAACLSYAGFRCIRDDGSLAHVPDWILAHQKAGVRLSLLTNHNIPETITMAKTLQAAGALLAVEGPNEPNNWPVEYGGQKSGYDTTALPIAQYQRDLYKAVKAEPTLKDIPVFHTSEAGGSEKDNVGLQFLTIPTGAGIAMPDGTQYADFANVHNYVCGHSGKLVDNVAWNSMSPTMNGDWDGLYVEFGKTWHGHFAGYSNEQLATLPKVCTETGWITQGKGNITEEQQARVFLNLYLGAFAQGWRHTFIYMLRDDPNQGYWGLFGTDYQAKKSGAYLHNLTTILADGGDTVKKRRVSKPGNLAYSIADQSATVHSLLLQKNDGGFELAIWDEKVEGSDEVTVNLGGSHAGVKVYDPTTGASPTQVLGRVSTCKLTLTDHPVILEIR